MNYRGIITLDLGKRGGRPCIRHMRIAVADVLGWLAAGMTPFEIVADFPELTDEDIRAALAYAAKAPPFPLAGERTTAAPQAVCKPI